MTFSIDKLNAIHKKYQKDGEAEDFYLILEEIKSDVFCLFATDFRNANEALSILINTMCHMEGEINQTIYLKLKCQILDLFIGIVEYPEIAWFVNKHFGLISILIDEQRKPDNACLNMKILTCLHEYLKFERNEEISFWRCEDKCCDEGEQNEIHKRKVLLACGSIVRSCLAEVNKGSLDNVEMSLMVLNDLHRQFEVQLSPESCGDANMYGLFKKFLISVFSSQSYSSVSTMSALSLMIHSREHGSHANKFFNDANSDYTLTLLYELLIASDNRSFEVSIDLLTDLLSSPIMAAAVLRLWTVEHFKTVCKGLLRDRLSDPCTEALLLLLMVVIDKAPDWARCLRKLLSSSSKLFSAVIHLTEHRSARCRLLAFRLLVISFQPSDIPETFLSEYVTRLTHATTVALRPPPASPSPILAPRMQARHLALSRAATDLFQMLLDADRLSGHLMSACVHTGLPAAAGSLCVLLAGEEVPSCASWARLAVSLAFLCVSLSHIYPAEVQVPKELQTAFSGRGLAICAAICLVLPARDRDRRLVENTVALLAHSTRLDRYDLTAFSEMIMATTERLKAGGRPSPPSSASETDLCALLSTQSSLSPDNTDLVARAAASLLSASPQAAPTESEAVIVLSEHIRALSAHEVLLHRRLDEKECALRQTEEALVDQRARTRKGAVSLATTATTLARVQCRLEASQDEACQWRSRAAEGEARLAQEAVEAGRARGEAAALAEKLAATEARLVAVSRDMEGSERDNKDLRALLNKAEAEKNALQADNRRLTAITQTIESLFSK